MKCKPDFSHSVLIRYLPLFLASVSFLIFKFILIEVELHHLPPSSTHSGPLTPHPKLITSFYLIIIIAYPHIHTYMHIYIHIHIHRYSLLSLTFGVCVYMVSRVMFLREDINKESHPRERLIALSQKSLVPYSSLCVCVAGGGGLSHEFPSFRLACLLILPWPWSGFYSPF
jgi:hypothetical protein